jgi:hypothetical protein
MDPLGTGPTAGGWTKARASMGANACVEVRSSRGTVAVRDSKNPRDPVLTFTRAQWVAFILGVKAGEFDR